MKRSYGVRPTSVEYHHAVQERRESLVIAAYLSNQPVRSISNRFNIADSTVYRILKDNNIHLGSAGKISPFTYPDVDTTQLQSFADRLVEPPFRMGRVTIKAYKYDNAPPVLMPHIGIKTMQDRSKWFEDIIDTIGGKYDRLHVPFWDEWAYHWYLEEFTKVWGLTNRLLDECTLPDDTKAQLTILRDFCEYRASIPNRKFSSDQQQKLRSYFEKLANSEDTVVVE